MMSKCAVQSRFLAFALLIAVGAGGLLAGSPARADDNYPNGVRIGMVNSLFRDVPEATLNAMMAPFSAVMQAQTGVRGELMAGGDMNVLAEQMAADKIQLGVFHG